MPDGGPERMLMSPEEIRSWDEQVRALHRSRSLRRNIAAILRDTKIGGAGDTERVALAKALAIVELLRKRGLVK